MNIHSIETGFFSTDGGAMFGIVSRKVWSRTYAVDSENRCPLAMRALFVDMGARKVLFDAGVGAASVEGMSYYKFHSLKSASDSLMDLGYDPKEVTDVVLSHLHFDHCGGCVRLDAAGNRVEAFPKARYWASRKQVELTFAPSVWEADSYAPDVVRLLQESGRLHVVDTDGALMPGVWVRLADGHTSGQLISLIDVHGSLLVFSGDVIPMSTHVMPLCIAAVDNCAEVSVREKLKLLATVKEKDGVLFFYHDATYIAADLKHVNGRMFLRDKIETTVTLKKKLGCL